MKLEKQVGCPMWSRVLDHSCEFLGSRSRHYLVKHLQGYVELELEEQLEYILLEYSLEGTDNEQN